MRQREFHHYEQLRTINDRVRSDPAGFVESCESAYRAALTETARDIAGDSRRVILLAGPSASGKTTTAHRLASALEKEGIYTHIVSLDDYFLSMDIHDTTIDLESPARMDLPLLKRHLEALAEGEEIALPQFDFPSRSRTEKTRPMRLRAGEAAIFEGIHALNDVLYHGMRHPPMSVYVSARMRVCEGEKVVFRPEWCRFLRRAVRDRQFRATTMAQTLQLWENIRRGEERYILPFKHRADTAIDSSFGYEVNLLEAFAAEDLQMLDADAMTAAEMDGLRAALEYFAPLAPSYVPEDSILREFIGKA